MRTSCCTIFLHWTLKRCAADALAHAVRRACCTASPALPATALSARGAQASLGLLEDTGLHALVASLRGCGNQCLKEQADRLCLGWLKLAGAVDDCRRTINKDSSRAPASLEPERSS